MNSVSKGRGNRILSVGEIYYDTIVQTGIDLDNWRSQFSDNYLAATYTIEGRHELQPIPQRELDLMPLYEQNAGWKE